MEPLIRFKRLYQIGAIFLTHGLDDLIPPRWLPLYVRLLRRALFWLPNRMPQHSRAKRLRLALEALGPVYIKLGQMLSTRRDLLPPELADELALLQDRVPPFDGALARHQIEQALDHPVEVLFDEFDETPLASASVAQVHTARLRETGQEVVLKVIRPDIEPLIQADIQLMYAFADLISRWLPDGRRLRPREVISEYEKSLFDELDLTREAANAIQLRRNFEGSELLYVPEVFNDHCRRNLLVMERIYGIQVSDIQALEAQGTNMKLLAERGVEVFFTQVFRDSFFHADMHPGNIFVSREHPDNPLWIGIDCGIVGTLTREDKRYLAGNLLAFFNQDYRRVAELQIDSGWVPESTRIEEFETAIRTVCEPIFAKPLAEISFGHVLLNLFNTARRFNMQVQPQLVLLQKTLLYVEGLGRQLYPQLDLWQTAKPFLEDWVKDQIAPQTLWHDMRNNAPVWAERMPELPNMLYGHLRQGQKTYALAQRLMSDNLQHNQQRRQANYLLGIGATLLLCTAILYGKSSVALQALTFSGAALSLGIGWLKNRH